MNATSTRPILRLVPDVPQLPVKPNPRFVDRRVALIEVRALLELFVEAGEDQGKPSGDGYSRADLMPYLEKTREAFEVVKRDLEVEIA